MTSLSDLLSLDDLVSLVTTGQEVAGTIDHEAFLTTILETAGRLTQSPDAAIILHDPRRNSLYFAHAIGSEAARLVKDFGEQALQQVPRDSTAGEVFHQKHTEVKLALEDDPSHFKGVDEATRKKTKSMITVPLIAAQECIGVMQILNKRTGDYTERDRLLLEQFASQAALALRNARLIGDLLAHMGLYSRGRNRRSAQELITLLSTPPQVENMTVMFVDLRGFRALCQRISIPEKLTKMLDQFLSMLVDQVLLHDGVVNKYLGDGILAFFRNENHELSAVNCAFKMVDAFAPLKGQWIDECIADISFLDIGVGICTEEVIIGPVGSERVKDFSVIGNVVNLAAAFEYEARGGKQIMVDQPTFSKVKSLYTADAPVAYELRQPGQPSGNSYKRFNLHRKEQAEPKPFMCFISHSQADQAFVKEHVVKELRGQGIESWISTENIAPGEQWLDAITKGLKTADFFIVIVSENSTKEKSKWVSQEIHVAMTLPQLVNRIIPICIDGTPSESVDQFLTSIQTIDYKEIPKLGHHLRRVVEASRAPT